MPEKHINPFAVSQGTWPIPPHSIVVVVVENVVVVVDVVVVDVVEVVVVEVEVVVVVVVDVVVVLVVVVVVGFTSETGEYTKKYVAETARVRLIKTKSTANSSVRNRTRVFRRSSLTIKISTPAIFATSLLQSEISGSSGSNIVF